MTFFAQTNYLKLSVTASAMLLALSACGGGDDPLPAVQPFKTLANVQPLVIAHRGASGALPEETLEAYARAIDLGADVVEPDLVSTKDGVLIARHDPNLDFSTDVAKRPEFASRKKTTTVDGETQTGWFASDFTLAEIKTLGALITDSERDQSNNGKFKVITFQELIDLVKTRSTQLGRTIAVYPETKNPSYHRALGLPLEDKLIAAITAAGWNNKTSPVYVQSFEPGSLKEMKTKGLQAKLIQLIDADDYDLKTGKLTYAAPYDRPYDWTLSGDTRLFSAMVTPAGLAEIKTYADGIGPWKPYIVPVKGALDAAGNLRDVNGDGKVNYNDASSQPPTTLIADAHKAGLFVHAYTFRNEQRRLAFDYNKDPKAEYLQFYRLGLDGVFSDFPDTALEARASYLRELGR
ncbi:MULTISPECIES: glycerophosphodiester phosphodiesterase [unclassified Polaromonas]|uniref:glycerophosphodiester phosphodiesterase n=1 Tax=unclassified Polaromonas TaxID=2638319 RepID=UPI0018CB5A19|nr:MULTISPECIES: glycerophosphodiester phosphodiesterase [unclassified Polaromonas]MBG6073725.1 glycerophosphoryl diester phosphodiesterase [Polaromonas sp. CG_9.7]MBG6115834.1 glycerophosphoryl diester phosphodiesterase [Polaromonas sp. CG_9.2]MDH6183407.1 glycerophosphoryl diester phosphodiesterase [Polaromonas sp. CG_23.6]